METLSSVIQTTHSYNFRSCARILFSTEVVCSLNPWVCYKPGPAFYINQVVVRQKIITGVTKLIITSCTTGVLTSADEVGGRMRYDILCVTVFLLYLILVKHFGQSSCFKCVQINKIDIDSAMCYFSLSVVWVMWGTGLGGALVLLKVAT